MKTVKKIVELVLHIKQAISNHHTGAYAAQASYFFILSFIPIFMLLITMIRYTPANMADLIEGVEMVFPRTISPLVESVIEQVYTQSSAVIPLTIITALWSAGKGVMALTNGLNLAYESKETRNYLYLRGRASLYTLAFLVILTLSLVLIVFGETLQNLAYRAIPFLADILNLLLPIRGVLTFAVLLVFWIVSYRVLPDRSVMGKTTFKRQVPGALFTTLGWLVLTYFFSIYLDVFTGFSTMYGSFTTLILVMIWLYASMYMVMIGGELNVALLMAKRRDWVKDKIMEKGDLDKEAAAEAALKEVESLGMTPGLEEELLREKQEKQQRKAERKERKEK